MFVVPPTHIILLHFYTCKFLYCYYSSPMEQWNHCNVQYRSLIYVYYSHITLFSPCSLVAKRDFFMLLNSSVLSSSSSLKISIFSSSWFCIWRRSARTVFPATQFWDTGNWRKRRWTCKDKTQISNSYLLTYHVPFCFVHQ